VLPVTYTEKHYLVEANYLYRILPKTYVGTVLSFEHTAGKGFSDLTYLQGEKTHYTATGLGVIVEYDSRDFIPNPFRGIYLSFQERIFPKGLGNCGKTLWRTMFKAHAYQRVWKDCILAADLYAVFNSEGTPWPMLARLGDNQQRHEDQRLDSPHRIGLRVGQHAVGDDQRRKEIDRQQRRETAAGLDRAASEFLVGISIHNPSFG